MFKRTAAVATLLVLGVAGCSSSDSNDTAPPADPAGSQSATSAAPVATEPEAPAYNLLSKGDLDDALLSIQDFPTGFSQDRESTPPNKKTFCDYKEPAKEKIRVDRDFTKGAGMDIQAGSVILRQFKDADTAKVAFDAMVNELKTCQDDTLEGSPATHTVTSAPKVGDDSIGVRTEVDGATALSNYALVGPTMIYAGTVSYVAGDADEAADLLVKQVDAYKAAASS